jgi:NAD-dependent SIR2 family protein deacetylase
MLYIGNSEGFRQRRISLWQTIPSRGTKIMNDEEKGTTEEQKSPENNPYFPVSKPISKEDFDRMPKRIGSHFTRGKNKESSCYIGLDDRGYYLFIDSKTKNLADFLPPEKRNIYTVDDEGKKIVYPKREPRPVSNPDQKQKERQYWIDGLTPRKVETQEIQIIGHEDLAKLINETPGRNLIFYTGAGVSTAGEVPVWNMSELVKQIGVDDYEAKGFHTQFNETPEQLLAKVTHFGETLFADVSTPAHIAIAEIVQSKPESIVFTENADFKHEAEGSRLSVMHAGNQTNDFLDVRLRAPEAKLLITVGLSKDDRSIINYLKRINPELKIVAINLVPTEYLDSNDAVVIGDCQKILPKVAELVKSS